MEAVSPYVEKIIVFTCQGLLTEPNSICRAGYPELPEKLYTDYMNWLENESK